MIWPGRVSTRKEPRLRFRPRPLRLSLLLKKAVVCGQCLVTLSLTVNETVMALIAAHLNAGVILVATASSRGRISMDL